MSPTFEDFGGDEIAWSDYCDEIAERDEYWEDDPDDFDPDAEDWGESALTVGERQ